MNTSRALALKMVSSFVQLSISSPGFSLLIQGEDRRVDRR